MCLNSLKIGSLWAFATVVCFGALAPANKTVVITEELKSQRIYDEVTYPARVSARSEAALLSEIDGLVESIAAPLGKKIAANTVVMKIKHTDPVYRFQTYTLRSPIEGVVSQLPISVGSRVVKGQLVASLIDPSRPRIMLEVPGTDLPDFAKDLVGQFSAGTAVLPVVVKGVSPQVDPATGTASVELAFAGEATQKLPVPGLMGKVIFRLSDHEGVQVPESALLYRNEKTLIRVVEDNKIRIVPVTTGKMRRGLIEITDGLGAGTHVVLRSSAYVIDGEEVQVQVAEKGTGAGGE